MTPQVQQILKDMKSQDAVKDVPVVKNVPVIPTIQTKTQETKPEEIKEEVKEDPNTFHMSQGYPLKK
jgi:hypothetical protein